MPIEIRELVIKTRVNEEPTQSAAEDANPASQEDLVAICVDKVMDLLKQQNER